MRTADRRLSLTNNGPKTPWVVGLLLVSLLVATSGPQTTYATPATFTQTSWTGGASATTAIDPTNQTNWDKLTATTSIGAYGTIQLATTTGSIVQTNDGTTNTGFNLTGNAVSSTVVTNSGDGASVVLTSTGGYTRPSAPTCSGTDHGGAAWTVTDNDAYDLNPAAGTIEIAGDHCNVGALTIPVGRTVYIKAYNGSLYGQLKIVATSVDISGTLNGNARGYLGGSISCPGGSGTNTGSYGSAGGSGGLGACNGGTSVGSTRGTTSGTDIDMGGGAGGSDMLAGEAGGGSAYLYVSGSVTVSGTVSVNGGVGGTGSSGSNGGACSDGGPGSGGGAGGSGGGVLINANSIAITGTISANGGIGGNGGPGGSGDWDCGNSDGSSGGSGDSGGGGRIKLFSPLITTSGGTVSATGFTSGTVYNSMLTTLTQTDDSSSTAAPSVQGGWDNRGASPYGGLSGMTTVQRNSTSGVGASVQLATAATPTGIFKDPTTRNGNLGGRSGADAICSASAQKPPGATTNIKAFLSFSSSDKINGMGSLYGSSSPIYWVASNGAQTLLANTWDDMLDGTIINKYPNALSDFTWTGATASGGVSANTCSGWTSTATNGTYGYNHVTDSTWLVAATFTCSNTATFSLRCIYSLPPTYVASGTYTSYVDAGVGASYNWDTFNWNQTANSGSTTVKVKTTTSTSIPSFASGTCNSGIVTGSSGSVTLSDTCRNSTHRYLWYQVTLNANNGNLQTPTLDDVQVGVGVTTATVYASSGTFTSGPIDVGSATVAWGNLSWSASGGQTITLKARSSTTTDFSTATAWATCSNITSGQPLSTGNCVTNGHRYIQYQAALSTADTSVTPSLDSVTIGYSTYDAAGNLTSSKYDTNSANNGIAALSWTEDTTLPASTGVTVSLRTAATLGGLTGAWTDFTNATTNCSKASGTVTCTTAAIPAGMKDGTGDQWFQYKVALTSSTGSTTPTISSVVVSYAPVDITPPTFTPVTIASNNASTTLAKTGDIITITATSSEAINTPTVTIAGHTATVWGSGNDWYASTTMQSGDSETTIPFTIDATDLAGNPAVQVTSITTGSNVIFDSTPPTLSLTTPTATITVGDTAPDSGVTATDSREGTLTSTIVTTGTVDTTTPGTYTLTYNVSDSAGNAATPVTYTVTVNAAAVSAPAPVIKRGNGGIIPVGANFGRITDLVPLPTPPSPPTEPPPAPHFTTPLAVGSTNPSVRTLQVILAQDKTIYPEGLVTGYFGTLTKKAVQRFQLKYKLVKNAKDPGYGYVGPKTRAQLTALTHVPDTQACVERCF